MSDMPTNSCIQIRFKHRYDVLTRCHELHSIGGLECQCPTFWQ
jgi:hypothetical protein